MNTTSASIKSSAPAASASRRSFMRYLTAGVAALAVEGCGGGAGTGAVAPAAPSPAAPVAPAAPAPVVVAPAAPVAPGWLEIPTIAFTEGTPASFSVAEYITAGNVAEVTLILNATPLPAGVKFNPVTRAFDYDGQGAAAVTDGHVLTAAVGA